MKPRPCSIAECRRYSIPYRDLCVDHITVPVTRRFGSVELTVMNDLRRDPYEAVCLNCGNEWAGTLTQWQALLVRVAGARCGQCHGFMVVEPTTMGSIGSVQTTTVAQGMAMRKRGGPQAA